MNFCWIIQYSYGGFTGWFLPSKDELNAMYTNRTAIGGFVSDWYWAHFRDAGGYYGSAGAPGAQ
jgi:hypothetical protein